MLFSHRKKQMNNEFFKNVSRIMLTFWAEFWTEKQLKPTNDKQAWQQYALKST